VSKAFAVCMRVFLILTIIAGSFYTNLSILNSIRSQRPAFGNEALSSNNATNDVKDDLPAPDNYLWNGTAIFLEAARSLRPVTDKVTSHTYQVMYGRFLMPYYNRNPSMKMLEIGLGCDMGYGPGASVALWQKLFPKANLWEAEYNSECVIKNSKKLEGINVLVGDQGNETVLDEWINKSGGNFDVIIDDGGHQNCQIWTSLQKLWPTVKSGGLYFIEDMQVGRRAGYMKFTTKSCNNSLIMSEDINKIIDKLLYKQKTDIESIFCQREACVLIKK